MNTYNTTLLLPAGFMTSFYILMFLVPGAIIALSIYLAVNTKFK